MALRSPLPYICTTCGVQYAPSEVPPALCPICADDRQYIGPGGQRWTSLPELAEKHRNILERITPEVWAVYTTPAFAIGQRAHLVRTAAGNLLWDCISLFDRSTKELIDGLGGLRAIALSHPHYLSTILEWSAAFGNIPVYIQALDSDWLGRMGPAVQLWEGDRLPLWEGLQVIRCGGHFPGASVLYDPRGAGTLFGGDTIQVAPNEQTVSFMYSYPNMIPLPAPAVRTVGESVSGLSYEALYGAFGRYIRQGADRAVQASVCRYLRAIGQE
ncbi:MAG TPA: MBL fold metallo-hydrolase [Chitinophagaceae bacterium]|jgi:hypothetical protein|nr:MBL fold metallo-hydrolase [Chitinophagaceae bacterium]